MPAVRELSMIHAYRSRGASVRWLRTPANCSTAPGEAETSMPRRSTKVTHSACMDDKRIQRGDFGQLGDVPLAGDPE